MSSELQIRAGVVYQLFNAQIIEIAQKDLGVAYNLVLSLVLEHYSGATSEDRKSWRRELNLMFQQIGDTIFEDGEDLEHFILQKIEEKKSNGSS